VAAASKKKGKQARSSPATVAGLFFRMAPPIDPTMMCFLGFCWSSKEALVLIVVKLLIRGSTRRAITVVTCVNRTVIGAIHLAREDIDVVVVFDDGFGVRVKLKDFEVGKMTERRRRLSSI
jgi:hypothetical protein